MRALVIYASSEGQTTKIAEHLAIQLRRNDIGADTYNVAKHAADEIVIDSYDAVLIGSPLHYAEYDSRVLWCIRDNLDVLKKLPSAFFSVSLGIHSKHAIDRKEVVKLTEDLFSKIGYQPDMIVYFAGAIRYSKYGWLKKRLMRWITKQHGESDADFSEREYTNWTEVEEFAKQFSNGLKGVIENAEPVKLEESVGRSVALLRTEVSVSVDE